MVAFQALVNCKKPSKEELIDERMAAESVSLYVFLQQFVVSPCHRSVNFIYSSGSHSIEVLAEVGEHSRHEFSCVVLRMVSEDFIMLANQVLHLLRTKGHICILGELIHQLQVCPQKRGSRNLGLFYPRC